MRGITRWAASHKIMARWIMVIGFILLFMLTALIGLLVQLSGYNLSTNPMIYIIIALLGIGILAYPSRSAIKRKIRLGKQYFRAWKIYDLTMIIAFTMMSFCVGHQFTQKTIPNYPIYQVMGAISEAGIHTNVLGIQDTDKGNKIKLFRFFKKLHKHIIQRVKILQEKLNKINNPFVVIALIILCIILVIILQYALVIIACELACSGQGDAAVIVFFGGSFVVFLVLFLAIRGILAWDSKRANKENNIKSNSKRARIIVFSLILAEFILFLFANK